MCLNLLNRVFKHGGSQRFAAFPEEDLHIFSPCVQSISVLNHRKQIMARLVDARAPLLPRGYRAGLLFCKEFGDWRRAMALMEDMRVAKRRPSGRLLCVYTSLWLYAAMRVAKA